MENSLSKGPYTSRKIKLPNLPIIRSTKSNPYDASGKPKTE